MIVPRNPGIAWPTFSAASATELTDVAARLQCGSVALLGNAPAAGFGRPVTSQEIGTVRATLAAGGMVLSSLDILPITPEFDPAAHESFLTLGSALGAQRIGAIVLDPDKNRAADNLGAFAARARAYDLRVSVEFISFTPLRTLADAVALIDRVGDPDVRITFDNLHFTRTGGRPEDLDASYRLLVASTTVGMAAWPAIAQTVAQPIPPAMQATHVVKRGDRLEEIVVTAQRVQRNLQKTPVAVTSFNAVAIKQQGVTSLLSLNALAPSLSVGSRGGYGPAAGDITIRGIGIDANPPSSPAVGVYIDDVYFPGAYGNLLGLFDVARVEVDRGPQGTLFGRNTIAGAIQYETVRPQLGKYSGFVEDTVGNLNRNDVAAGVNIPIGDIAALRVSGGIDDRDGYVHDEGNGVNFGGERTSEARAQLRIRPTADLTIDLKAEYVHDRSNGQATVPIAFDYDPGQPGNDILGQAYPPGFLDQYLRHDIYKIAGLDGRDFAKTQFRIAQGEITYRLSDMLTLKSITAASANESQVATDEDRTPVLLLDVGYGNTDDRLFTQELQVIGNALNNRLNFTLGGYFYDDITTNVGESGVLGIKLGPPPPPFLPPIAVPTDIFGNFNDGTQSYAGYGQATFSVTKQLAVVGGLRYTSEKATASDNLNSFQPQTDQTFTDISPMVGLNYQVTPDMLLYFKDSRGFRAGGFSPNAASYNFYGPENATTYELGSRMEFLGHRLRVNPTVFLTDWNNIQFNASKIIIPPGGQPQPFPVIENAGNANIKGAEIELQGQVTDDFLVTASGSLLDGKYTQIDPTIATELKAGDGLSRSPQSAYTLGGRYTLPLSLNRTLTFSVNYSWQAHQRSATTDDEAIPIPSYGLLNARVDFQPFGDRLTLSGFATNLAGTKYYYGGTNFASGGLVPTVDATVGAPREYGITARASF